MNKSPAGFVHVTAGRDRIFPGMSSTAKRSIFMEYVIKHEETDTRAALIVGDQA